VLAKEFNEYNFRAWPKDLAMHETGAVVEKKNQHKDEIVFEAFLQWALTEQIFHLRRVSMEGEFIVDHMFDQPIAFGNADAWSNLGAFIIDPDTLRRDYTMGVPPHRLDIPQHWQFYLPKTNSILGKRLLLERFKFVLQFSDLVRIDHLLGYYRFYYMYEDPAWEMTLEKMGVWSRVNEVMQSQMSVADKRYHIFDAIITGIKRCFPQSALAQFFDQRGFMRPAHTVLVARKDFDNSVKYNREESGWYKQSSTEHNQDLLYAMLSPSEHGEIDYLGKIIGNGDMLLQPTDSIRICFYNPELGEEIIQAFMHYAQEQGKQIVCEDLGVVPKEISHSLWQQRAKRWRELYFGYKHFTDDPNNPYWFANITGMILHVSYLRTELARVDGGG
jgi:hypothetical protein